MHLAEGPARCERCAHMIAQQVDIAFEVTEEEVGIESFAERLRAAVTSQEGAMTTWGFVTAWARKE